MKVIRNTSLYMAAGLVPNLVNLLILPVYTRFLDPADYGMVALVMTFVTFFGTIMGLQLSNSISRLYFDYTGADKRIYASTILNSTVLINIGILLPIHIFGPRLVAFLYPAVDIPYCSIFLPGLVLMFFQNLINFGNAMLRVQERGWSVFSGAVLHVLISVTIGVYGIVFRGWGATGLLLAMASSTAAHGLYYLYLLRQYLSICFDKRMLGHALVYSVPIIPHSLGGMLFMMSDKYVASFFVDIEKIGLYEFADKFALVFHFMVISFYHALSPVFMRDALRNKQETAMRYERIITQWMVMFSFVCLGMGLFLGDVIAILFPVRFHASSVYIPILLIAYLFRGLYGFAADALLFMKKTYLVPVITLAAGGLNVIANIFLLPHWGMIAAAWTTLLSLVVSFLLAVSLSRRVYALNYDWPRLLKVLIILVGMLYLGSRTATGVTWADISIKALLLFFYVVWVWISNIGKVRDLCCAHAVSWLRKAGA